MVEVESIDVASTKEKFDLAFNMLKDYHTIFIDSLFKSLGVLILIIGWLAVNEQTRKFVAGSTYLQILSITALIVASGIYCLYCKDSYDKSRKACGNLDALKYMPKRYYESYCISHKTMVLAIIGNVLAILVAIFIICCSRSLINVH